MSHGKRSMEFTELADFTLNRPDEPPMLAKHNVIKRSQVVARGIQEVGLGEADGEDPLVLVQRDGDRVTGVDFLCKCGRSAKLKLEYDEE